MPSHDHPRIHAKHASDNERTDIFFTSDLIGQTELGKWQIDITIIPGSYQMASVSISHSA